MQVTGSVAECRQCGWQGVLAVRANRHAGGGRDTLDPEAYLRTLIARIAEMGISGFKPLMD